VNLPCDNSLLLILRQGKWKNKQIVSESWIKMATTPTKIGQDYGYLWWLNTQGKQYPSAPTTSFAALGAGSKHNLDRPRARSRSRMALAPGPQR
jgi:CubicO group peptidase (beta-lactamase class C family)